MFKKLRHIKISDYPLAKDFILMLFFGGLSYFFGLVKFYLPEVEGTGSDFREIPLIKIGRASCRERV